MWSIENLNKFETKGEIQNIEQVFSIHELFFSKFY